MAERVNLDPAPFEGWLLTDEEYSNLLTTQLSADYVYGITVEVANTPDDIELIDTRSFARNLLDEWTK